MIEHLRNKRETFVDKLGNHFTIAAPRPQIIVTDYCINSLKMWVMARFREMIGNQMNNFDLSSIERQDCEMGLCIHSDAVGKAYKHTIINGRLFTKTDQPYLESQISDTSPLLLYLGCDQQSGPRLTEFIRDQLVPLLNELEDGKLVLHWNNKIFLKIKLLESKGSVLLSADNAGRTAVTGFKGAFFLFFFMFAFFYAWVCTNKRARLFFMFAWVCTKQTHVFFFFFFF